MVRDEDIKEILGGHVGSRGNWITTCPFCGKEEHFYIKLNTQEHHRSKGYNKSYKWQCKRCGESGGLKRLLAQVGRLDLLSGTKVDVRKELVNFIEQEVEEGEIVLELEECKLPFGFKSVKYDEYLDARGFTPEDYIRYKVGRTELTGKLIDYIIIPVEENNVNVAYFARTVHDKKQIKKIEERTGKKYPRYRNASVDFALVVVGLDEITFMTRIVIIVEGFFDKVRLDRHFELWSNDEIKCVCTNGKNVSVEQILKIIRKGNNVQDVILLQDNDAVKDTKKVGTLLSKYFDNVLVGYVPEIGKDIDETSDEDIDKIFNNLETLEQFSLQKVNIQLLS